MIWKGLRWLDDEEEAERPLGVYLLTYMASVEIRALRKRFGDHDAVDGVDLSIRDGELLVLLGPSGCGKTTLLRMIAGLEHPSAGEIYIGSRRVDGVVPPRARGIAMVFQSYALYPHRTVFGNIAFPLEAAGLPRANITEKVRWAADLFGITRYLDRYPRQLSGGERQRVALCRALVRDPQVFLLDEPLANLDAKLRNTARDELKRFQRQIRRTTVYVTHDQVEALGLGDRIAVMDRGCWASGPSTCSPATTSAGGSRSTWFRSSSGAWSTWARTDTCTEP